MSYYKMVNAYRIFPRSFSHTRLGLRPRPVLKTTSSGIYVVMRGRIKSAAAAYYIRATYALRVLYQLPLSDISTSCDRWHTYRIWALFMLFVSPKNAIMCWGDSVRGPVQLSAAFLPLSVLFRDSMTAVNYGWTLSASCGSRANLGRLVGR